MQTSPDDIVGIFPEMMRPEIKRLVQTMDRDHSLQAWAPLFIVLAEVSHRMIGAASKAAAIHRPWWLRIQFAATILLCVVGFAVLGVLCVIHSEIKDEQPQVLTIKPPSYVLDTGTKKYRFQPEKNHATDSPEH